MNFLEEIYGFWNDSHKKNIINLTRQILTVTIAQGFYFWLNLYVFQSFQVDVGIFWLTDTVEIVVGRLIPRQFCAIWIPRAFGWKQWYTRTRKK